MEELLELRARLEQRDYQGALALVNELEEMSRDDKINKIRSFARVLLLHLIRQAAEKRTTRSWDLSAQNAALEIHYVNTRRKTGGSYLSEAELREVIGEAYPLALKAAALEVLEGRLEAAELAKRLDRAGLQEKALDLIRTASAE
jgi:hypothetical protein